jgi:hypothetical protein
VDGKGKNIVHKIFEGEHQSLQVEIKKKKEKDIPFNV